MAKTRTQATTPADPNIVAIERLTPRGQSPRIYHDLIKKQVLGVDKSGWERPFEDLMLFMYVAKRTGLDPLARQIYAVYRWDYRTGKEVMTIQAGIDGLRVVAQRTGEYGGSDDAVFVEKDDKPLKATVTVYKVHKRTGERMAVVASARYGEYVQEKDGKPMGMWAKMPFNQLAKCAEALALRKAFPNVLSNVYSSDEMGQAENGGVEALPPPPKPAMTATNTNKARADKKAAEAPEVPPTPPVPQADKPAVVEKPVMVEQIADPVALRAKLKQ